MLFATTLAADDNFNKTGASGETIIVTSQDMELYDQYHFSPASAVDQIRRELSFLPIGLDRGANRRAVIIDIANVRAAAASCLPAANVYRGNAEISALAYTRARM